MEFKDWINKKFVEWRGNTRRGVSDYAEYIGVPQPTISSWLNGVKPRSPHNIEKLFLIYKDEIFDNGIVRPKESLYSLPPNIHRNLMNAQREIEQTLRKLGITREMPMAETIATRIMAKHGIKYTTAKEDSDTDK